MPYNEIYDEIGAKRPQYAAIQTRTAVDVTKPDSSVVSTLSRDGIHPVPLVLDEDEYQSTLVPGMLQRALTLQALFEDIAIGSARVIDTGLVRPDEVECILASEGLAAKPLRQLWKGQSREQIRFVYGPDLVRGPEGEWVVLEDNVGCVGGVAAGFATRDAYVKAAGLGPGHPSTTDLARAIKCFLERVGIQPDTSGLFGFAGRTPPGCGTSEAFETQWKADCLRSFGITVTRPEELLDRIRQGAADPTAMVNLSATQTAAYRELARVTFTKSPVPVLGAPGVELIASKSFLPFDEALVAEYLDEQLVIRSASSRLVRERPDHLPDKGVLKRSNGCQGTEVFFLDEIRDEDGSRTLLETVRQWGPCAAIIQERVERSFLPGTGIGPPDPVQVEIRPIVYVYGWRAAFVGEAVAARALPVNAERRGNISPGGFFLPVLREASNKNAGREGCSLRGPLVIGSLTEDRRGQLGRRC